MKLIHVGVSSNEYSSILSFRSVQKLIFLDINVKYIFIHGYKILINMMRDKINFIYYG